MADPIAAPRGHRTWPQRLLISFNVVCIVAALGTAGALGYFNTKLSEISRVSLDGVIRSGKETPPGAPLNYLLVGADDDTGLDPNAPEARGRGSIGGLRSDTIMILRVDPADATARLLSFPRDLWVPISGQTSKNRINSAIETGGPQKLIATINEDFGIPIDHYVQVNFASFKELVKAIDGVPIYFPEPVRSKKSTALEIPNPGCWTLTPDQALAFARVRKDYQVYRDGRWQTDLSGDLGRISRQQYFIQSALKRAIAKGVRNPNTMRQLVDLGVRTVVIDDNLKAQDVVSLGGRFRNFNPDNLVKYSIPVTDAVKGGAQVLEMKEAEAEPMLAIFRGQPGATDGGSGSTAIVPAVGDVEIAVQNGSGAPHQATDVSTEFGAIGFRTGMPSDAQGFNGNVTTLRYSPGQLPAAQLVARHIANPVVFEELPAGVGADVVVVTAPDWQGTLSTPKPADQVTVPSTTTSSTTTTTQPSTTTTSTTLVGELPGAPPPGVTC